MKISKDCPKCDGNGEVQDTTPNRRSRFVGYGDLSPEDYVVTCDMCGGSGVADYDPHDDVEDWMTDD